MTATKTALLIASTALRTAAPAHSPSAISFGALANHLAVGVGKHLRRSVHRGQQGDQCRGTGRRIEALDQHPGQFVTHPSLVALVDGRPDLGREDPEHLASASRTHPRSITRSNTAARTSESSFSIAASGFIGRRASATSPRARARIGSAGASARRTASRPRLTSSPWSAGVTYRRAPARAAPLRPAPEQPGAVDERVARLVVE